MKPGHPQDLSQLSMLELFRLEVDGQSAQLTRGLLKLEENPTATDELPALMRAAHSLKGAARIVNRETAVRIAHAMEDCLTSFSNKAHVANSKQIDGLLAAVDLLVEVAALSDLDLDGWTERKTSQVDGLLRILGNKTAENVAEALPVPEQIQPVAPSDIHAIRVSSENLNRLLFLAGESLVVSHRLDEHSGNLQRLKRGHHELSQAIGRIHERVVAGNPSEPLLAELLEIEQRAAACSQAVAQRLEQGEGINRQLSNLSQRLHQEVLDCRMRPLAEAVGGLPRMVRDIGRELGKSVRLEILGGETTVDRDILDRLKIPLMHLVRNAVDHGIENPEQRRASGKSGEGVIRLEACHRGGILMVSVADDGIGIDRISVRAAIVAKGLTTTEAVEKMSDTEVDQFLFLPGFSMKKTVTDVSGRGVGLDVVQTAIREIGGTIKLLSKHQAGARFDLELPLTLSLIRALLVDIAGEPYAFPLARITGVAKLAKHDIGTIEGRQHFKFRGSHVGLITARQILELDSLAFQENSDVSVVVISDERGAHYGLAVDRFLGERELVVLGLDPELGKVRSISAGALMPDDSPLLILDVDDLLRSIETAISAMPIEAVPQTEPLSTKIRRKRILAVDDSLTVRELERKLLQGRGYDVETAVDGMDAWNHARSGRYDLIVTDVDMPRMDGIELLQLIKKDVKLQSVPVLIVSYKDREEDRRRGLDAGADYYLTKGSFHDESLLQAVTDLIGEADS